MTVLVNYYTSSYGDSFVNMFNGNPALRVNGIARCNFANFVDPDFYIRSLFVQKQIWQRCQQLKLKSAPCHRQQGFDFSQAFGEDVKVITIELGDVGFLPARLKKIHIDGRGKSINDPVFDQLLKSHPDRYQEIIVKDYEKWAAINKLPTDIEFQFSWINDPGRVQEFCRHHDLGFDNAWLENIKQDLRQYALL